MVKGKIREIAVLTDGLIIAEVEVNEVREQDINARIMKDEMFKQLVDNIRKRGALESLPLCAVVNGVIEVISGHHRFRALKQLGVKTTPVILDESGLTRSQIVAKQLAHNAISGFDDENTLRQLVKMMDNVDDMIESFLGKDYLGEVQGELEKLISPTIEFDWDSIMFMFLPHQTADLDKAIKLLNEKDDESLKLLGYAPLESQKAFMEALSKQQQVSGVKNIGALIHTMIEASNRMLEGIDFEEDKEYIPLAEIFGGASLDKESAEIIKQALKKMEQNGTIDSKHKVRALVYWASEVE